MRPAEYGKDLVEIVAMNIEAQKDKETADKFKQHEFITYVMDKPEPIQRIGINRYFNTVLLQYRAMNDVEVNDLTFMLVNDGDVNEWIKIIKGIVLPFSIANKII